MKKWLALVLLVCVGCLNKTPVVNPTPPAPVIPTPVNPEPDGRKNNPVITTTSTASFGKESVGTTTKQAIVLKSTGSSPVTVSKATVAGSSMFTVTGPTLPITLNTNQTATFTVTFSPTASGSVTGTLAITSNSSTGSTLSVALSGTGIPVLNGIACTPTTLTGASTSTCTATLNSLAGTGGVTIPLTSSNSALTVPASVTVAAGQSVATFTATSSAVTTNTSVTISGTSGTTATATIQLSAPAGVPGLAASTTSVDWGPNISIGQTVTQNITLTNPGTASTTISSISVAGSLFGASGLTLPYTISPGNTAILKVSFAPLSTSVGYEFTGVVTITSNASTVTINLAGGGVTAAGTPTALTCQNATVTGTGTDACTVTVNSAPTSPVSIALSSNNPAVTVPSTVTVASGATTGTFNATVVGSTSAQSVTLTATGSSVSETFGITVNPGVPTLTINSNSIAFGNVNVGSSASQAVTVTSTGTAPVSVSADTLTQNPHQYTVILSWQAPTPNGDPVANYLIFRAVSGSTTYTQIGSVPAAQLSYADTNVTDGTSYNYYVESQDASQANSSPSNTTTVAIPTS